MNSIKCRHVSKKQVILCDTKCDYDVSALPANIGQLRNSYNLKLLHYIHSYRVTLITNILCIAIALFALEDS
jgi:hypothetical protein